MKKIIVAFLSICLLNSLSFGVVEGTNRTVKVNKVISDEISESGEVDYFNFRISKYGSLQLRFDFDIEGTYNVKLVDTDTGKTVQSNSFSSNVNTSSGRCERLSNKIRIPKGEYQVQVSQNYWQSCDEEYELEIIFDEENSDRYEKEPNNDAKNAMIIDYNTSVTGNLESQNDVDYYMVEIPTYGELSFSFEFDKDATYAIEIFKEKDGSLSSIKSVRAESKLSQSSDTYTINSEKVRVPEGNYYFKVSKGWFGSYSNNDYELRVRFTSNSYGYYEEEDNDSPKSANEIRTNCEYVGNMSSSSDVDYYKASVWGTSKITLKMNVPEGASYNVTTYKVENDNLKQIKNERFNSNDLAGYVVGEEQEVSGGEYYFKVTSRTYSNEDYTFLVETANGVYNRKTIVLEINNPYMMVDGKSYAIDGSRGTAPTILNGRTMLPARAIIEEFGGTVTWIESAGGININLNGKNVYLTLDSALAYVNGETMWLDVAPTSINGRTMIPVKFVMDNLGGSVIWNATTGTVTITY